MASLRDKQIASLKRMLNLNEPVADGSDDANHSQQLGMVGPDGELIWKVLVFDDLGMQIVSSVLRVSDLRSLGVTMHMHLSANRHRIEDVPVIYLVEPTTANLKAITGDLEKDLYSPAYINFLSSIPRPLLEDFASETVANGTQDHVSCVAVVGCRRQEDKKTRRQEDKKTRRQEDKKTRRQEDKKTRRQEDKKTRRQRD